MDPDKWIRDCEAKGVNPYYEAIAKGITDTISGDTLGARAMRGLARKMKKRGYQQQSKAAEASRKEP